jgi:uncharacterized protein with HEPN domain
MRRSDEVRLRHMLDAAYAATRLAHERARGDLDSDEGLAHSLVRVIQIIGEAANHVDESIRESNPSIPWTEIISMRNRLVHAYHDINLDIVWKTVREDLPLLTKHLEVILPSEAP